jgi:hypothetical protein
MKIAITDWNNRIAPVFDAAHNIYVFSESAQWKPELLPLVSEKFLDKIDYLVAQDIDVLICGGISRQAWQYAIDCSIEVHPFVAGTTTDGISTDKI